MLPHAAAFALFAGAVIGMLSISSSFRPASIFSMFQIGNLASAKEIQHGSHRLYNAQTIPLLHPVNNIDPRPPRGGSSFSLADGVALAPEGSPSGESADVSVMSKESDQISLYVVREGDSLSQIASMYGVSVNTIIWANNLPSRPVIKEGMELVILPVSGVKHTIKKGDTLASIAKQYKGDVDEILQFNGLPKGSALAAGEEILIPGGEIIPAKAATAKVVSGGSSNVTISGYFIHPAPGAAKTQGIHGYNGVDFGASVGTPIRASASGTVIVSRSGGWNGGYGNYIVIDHPNGTQTLYAHLSSNMVWSGAGVEAGQVIGAMGSTGRSTGSHLHFEVRGARNPF